MTQKPPITPETKVGALLDAYPELEETLIALSPAFKKLRNPILRRTVGRIATLEKAAEIGGLTVRELVIALRRAAGLETEDCVAEEPAPSPADSGPPAWFDRGQIVETIDADALLAAGEHPLGRIKRHLDALAPGAIVRLTSSFRPAPLIEHVERSGFQTYVISLGQDRLETFIANANPPDR